MKAPRGPVKDIRVFPVLTGIIVAALMAAAFIKAAHGQSEGSRITEAHLLGALGTALHLLFICLGSACLYGFSRRLILRGYLPVWYHLLSGVAILASWAYGLSWVLSPPPVMQAIRSKAPYALTDATRNIAASLAVGLTVLGLVMALSATLNHTQRGKADD